MFLSFLRLIWPQFVIKGVFTTFEMNQNVKLCTNLVSHQKKLTQL